MSLYLRVLLGIVVAIYFVLIMHFVKKKMLALKYTLLWLLSGAIMAVLVLFPGLLSLFVQCVGIETPINGLFTVAIFVILLILMSLTAIVSKQTDRIRSLAQYIAMLEQKEQKDIENIKSSMENGAEEKVESDE